MKIPVRERGSGLKFDITPLIDIVFLLIIFFLVATHLVNSESRTKVDLAEAVTAEDEEAARHRMVVTIKDEKLELNGEVRDLEYIESKILSGAKEYPKDFELHIRADRVSQFEDVKPLISACASSGVKKIKYMVLKKNASSG